MAPRTATTGEDGEPMSLRTRLLLTLGALFLVPLVVGVLVLAVAVPQVKGDQARNDLITNQAVVADELASHCRDLGVTARALGLEAVATTPQQATAQAVATGTARYAAVVAADGSIVAESGRRPVPGTAPQDLRRCGQDGRTGAVLAQRVSVKGGSTAQVAVTAERVDAAFLQDIQARNRLSGAIL